MDRLYEFLSGPALWAAFTIFLFGLTVRFTYLYTLRNFRKKAFNNDSDSKGDFRSIVCRLFVPEIREVWLQLLFSAVFIVFIVCLPVVPLFLLAHNTLWEEAFSLSLPSLPESASDFLTMVFIAAAFVLLAARIFIAEIRSRAMAWDYCLPLLAAAPFIAGFLAYHQIGPYRPVLILHILCAEALLVAIPFSKLGISRDVRDRRKDRS